LGGCIILYEVAHVLNNQVNFVVILHSSTSDSLFSNCCYLGMDLFMFMSWEVMNVIQKRVVNGSLIQKQKNCMKY